MILCTSILLKAGLVLCAREWSESGGRNLEVGERHPARDKPRQTKGLRGSRAVAEFLAIPADMRSVLFVISHNPLWTLVLSNY
jgi:hypothetical protein